MRELSDIELDAVSGGRMYSDSDFRVWRGIMVGGLAGAITAGPIGAAVGMVAGGLVEL